MYEILSVVFAPLILWLSLPNSAEAIVDFVREFTIHVDSLGYVCSFAVFDFKRHGNVKYGAPSAVSNDYYVSKQGKMEQSFVNFKLNNPEWQPDTEGSLYLSSLQQRSPIRETGAAGPGLRRVVRERPLFMNRSPSPIQVDEPRMEHSILSDTGNGMGVFELFDAMRAEGTRARI